MRKVEGVVSVEIVCKPNPMLCCVREGQGRGDVASADASVRATAKKPQALCLLLVSLAPFLVLGRILKILCYGNRSS
jgi:hypothetical protein